MTFTFAELIFAFIIGIIIGIMISANHLYKRGQIDAINGIIKYELVEQTDKIFIWEEIKNKL
jgi:hypothetical protein